MTVQSKITSAAAEATKVLNTLGVADALWTGGNRPVRSPVTGEVMAHVHDASKAQVDAANQQPAVVAAMAAARVSLLQLRRTLNLPLSQPLVLESSLRFQDSTILVPDGVTTDPSARPALLKSIGTKPPPPCCSSASPSSLPAVV